MRIVQHCFIATKERQRDKMPILDTLTDAIANPCKSEIRLRRTVTNAPEAHVRSRQERAAQRMFQGLDKKMMAARDISPEPTPKMLNGM